MSPLEAASTLNHHPGTIKRLCRQGKLRGEKVNNGWLIPWDVLEEFAKTVICRNETSLADYKGLVYEFARPFVLGMLERELEEVQ
jgi:excisionase family DNA binding protein